MRPPFRPSLGGSIVDIAATPGGHFAPHLDRFSESSSAACDWFRRALDLTREYPFPEKEIHTVMTNLHHDGLLDHVASARVATRGR